MARSARSALIEAAERLFAERGAGAVSLREINAAAGVANASAIQYHFGDRAGLERALLAKHAAGVEERRHALLDAYEAAGRDDLRALAAALVEPLAAELEAEGGPGYLQLLAEIYNRPMQRYDPGKLPPPASSMGRWRALVEPLLEPDAVRLHRRFDALRFTASELARRGRSGRKDHRLFTSQLVDLVTGLLSAPVSDETARLLRR